MNADNCKQYLGSLVRVSRGRLIKIGTIGTLRAVGDKLPWNPNNRRALIETSNGEQHRTYISNLEPEENEGVLIQFPLDQNFNPIRSAMTPAMRKLIDKVDRIALAHQNNN